MRLYVSLSSSPKAITALGNLEYEFFIPQHAVAGMLPLKLLVVIVFPPPHYFFSNTPVKAAERVGRLAKGDKKSRHCSDANGVSHHPR